MDSLTQIILGAACGEIALGKKIGNKALLFGAIGGTIPDLDVIFGNLFYSNGIDQLAFHRGFMHSILFAILASFALGYLVYKLYNTQKRTGTTTQKNWTWLFFLSIFTHPLLDSFTPYGTQLFLPFSDYRVAFNNISVVDPLYTIPFLGCLIVVLFFNRNNPKRLTWTKAGIYISSFYMVFTIGLKIYIDTVFKKSFEKSGVSYTRFTTQPSLLNTVLWYGIAETETNYSVGFYSLFDKSSTAEQLITIPKNHELLDKNDTDLKTLAWFSDGYYNIVKNNATGKTIYNDLRYPIIQNNNENNSVFSFVIQKEGARLNILPREDRFSEERISDVFAIIWNRMKGI